MRPSPGADGSFSFRSVLTDASGEDHSGVSEPQSSLGENEAEQAHAPGNGEKSIPGASSPASCSFQLLVAATPEAHALLPAESLAVLNKQPQAAPQTDGGSDLLTASGPVRLGSTKRPHIGSETSGAMDSKDAPTLQHNPVAPLTSPVVANQPELFRAVPGNAGLNGPSELKCAAAQDDNTAATPAPAIADGSSALKVTDLAFGVKIRTAHQDKAFAIPEANGVLPLKGLATATAGSLKSTVSGGGADSTLAVSGVRNGHGSENQDGAGARQHADSQSSPGNRLYRHESDEAISSESSPRTNEMLTQNFGRGPSVLSTGSSSTAAEMNQTPSAQATTAVAVADRPHPVVDAGIQAGGTVVKNVSIQVEGERGQSVEIRIEHRAGELNVDVRSGDTDLSQKLRQNLGELENKLGQTGYKAEAFQPGAADTRHQQSQSQDRSHNQDQRGNSQSNSGGQQQQRGTGQQRNNQDTRPRVNGPRFQQMFSPELEGATANGIGS